MKEIIDVDTMAGFWPQRPADISPRRLLSMMDQHGVGRACVVSARGALFDDVDGNSETLAWSQAEPRFIPVGTIDLRKFVGYKQEISRLSAAGVRLWRLFPEYQGWTPDLATFRRVVAVLDEAGAALLISAQPSAVARAVAGSGLPIILNLHFYQAADLLALLEEGTTFYVSARLLHGPGVIETLAGALGYERIIYGSGAPLSSMGSVLRRIEAAELAETQRDAILGGNLRRLLGLERPERSEGLERPERSEGLERPERSEGLERPEHSEGLERPERSEGLERPERSEGLERPEHSEGLERPEHSEGGERHDH